MINKKEILGYLDRRFERTEKLHKEHKKRVEKAIEWFESNTIDKSVDTFGGEKVNVNNVVSVCIENNMMGVPGFECYFIFMPSRSVDDCGSGCGMQHKIEF